MRIVIVGSGGVGGLLGALLARAGAQVAFVARGQNLAALRSEGLRVEGTIGSFSVPAFEASDDPARLGPAGAVLRAAARSGVEVPLQRFLFGALWPQELVQRARSLR